MALTSTLMCPSTSSSVPVCLHKLWLPSALKKVVGCREVRGTGWQGSVTEAWHNACRKHASQTFAVCSLVLTCWNHSSPSKLSVSSCVFSIAHCHAEFTGTHRLPSSKKCGPLIPKAGTAHEMVTGTLCKVFWTCDIVVQCSSIGSVVSWHTHRDESVHHQIYHSRFQTFAVIWILYMFFWVFPRHQIVVGRRFGTLCQFHLQRLDVDSEVCQAKPSQSSNWGRRLALSASRRPPVC